MNTDQQLAAVLASDVVKKLRPTWWTHTRHVTRCPKTGEEADTETEQLQWEGDKFTSFISTWERHDWVPTPENLMADDWEICT